jgi:Big-like domain-containing protein/VCBS repeat protein
MSRKSAAKYFTCVIVLLFLAPASLSASKLFRPVQVYSSGGENASSVAVADVNGDGKIDLVVLNSDDPHPSSFAVLLGNGDGTFQAARTHVLADSKVFAISLADLNRDGRVDLLVATSGGVSVLLGNGDGTFQTARQYSGGVKSMTVIDLNGDGKLDLVMFSSTVSVLLGNGDGTFQAAITFEVGSSPGEFVAADVNSDGKPDLLIRYNGIADRASRSGVVGVSLGNGDGTFQREFYYLDGGFNRGGIAVADVNGDGKPDVIVGNECRNNCRSSSVAVLLGDGSGSFQRWTSYNPGGYSIDAIQVAEVNSDGVPDLFVANACDNFQNCDQPDVALLVGTGDGGFSAPQRYLTGGQGALSIAVGDANGDGIPDAFVAGGSDIQGVGVIGVLLSFFVTTTDLASVPNPSVVGQPVTLTATITSSGPTTPTGKVTFKNAGKSIGSATLIGNVATLTKGNLPVGTLSITATYSGDTQSSKSTSTALVQVVNPAAEHR